ncbi:MAG: FxsA family protein [Gammaproteobacteria bacterium]
MRLFPLFFLLFITVPLLEIYLFIKVGSLIGALPTIGIILLTAFTGAVLLRQQGISAMFRVQQSMARGQLPAVEMFEGMLIAAGGLLLLTPGFFTDFLGLLCMIPPLRRALVHWLLRRAVIEVQAGRAGPDVIEGEYSVRRDDDDQDRRLR